MSPQISARVSEDLDRRITAYSAETDCSKSEAIRELLERGFETEDLENENKQLRAQLAATNRRIDDANDVLDYLRDEDGRENYQDRRLAKLDNATIWERFVWQFTGVPVDADREDDEENDGS